MTEPKTSGKIAIITTSTRTPRVGPKVSAFIHEMLLMEYQQHQPALSLTLVDVAEFKLPLFDEPVLPALVPAQASFIYEHSKKWSTEIAQYDGYVFVIPEYNHGMSGSTKNAVDYLFHEWVGKPVLIVSYGTMGGANASKQFKDVLQGMRLKVCATSPTLPFKGGIVDRTEGFAAGKSGILGEATRGEWEENKKEEILKGFGELLNLLSRQN
ncbi:flavoprotein-like protein [Talaromyces proteolyticus]|uniref:Flavoprotein-like protein n=1 Tax=Talaromyces proteolyticus TaxID=1131652 RepID=A0AAD4Q0R9_9EURO|nr:flavoprotein-like protein [Talaromyces proteolyticus]KAH8697488.1 flavoprotein-like protein [Talaromyces proteolyticus]